MSSAIVTLALALCLSSSATPTALSGTLLTPENAPIPGASIVVHHAGGTETAQSNDKGEFAIASVTLPATVDITADGFSPVHREIPVGPPGPVVFFIHLHYLVRESVVVSGQRAASWREPDTGVTVLKRADLDSVPAVTFDESLRAVSGFSLFRRSSASTSNPTTHGVTMRGLSASGSSRALVLLDGVPLNDGFGGWITWTRLPAAAVDRVEIQRGATGDAWGTDALGGVIRLVSPTLDHRALQAGIETGSTGLGAVDVSGGDQRGRLSWFGASSWFESSGTIPVQPSQRGTVDRATDVTWKNVFGRADIRLQPGRRLTLFGWGGVDDRGNGTVLQRNRMSGATIAGTYDLVAAKDTFAARMSWSPNRFVQSFSTVASSRATETLTSTQTTTTHTPRMILEWGHTLSKAQVTARGFLTVGSATFNEVKPSATTSQGLLDHSKGGSVQMMWVPVAAATVDLGLRHEWREAPGKGTVSGPTIGHASLAWQAAPAFVVRSSIASSHRWPTLNELIRNFQAGNITTLANPALKPERAWSVDVAAAYTKAKWSLSFGAFRTVTHDAIANVTLNSTTRQRQNAGDAVVNGGELDGEVRLIPRLRLRASLTAVDARFRHSTEPLLEDRRLPQVPRFSMSFTADVTLPRTMSVSALWHAASSQFDDDRNTPSFLMTAAHQLDLRVSGRVGRFTWHAEVANALNARIEVGRSAPAASPIITLAPGRAYRVGLTVAIFR